MTNSPVREVLPAEAVQLVDAGAVLLDTREQHEWNAGHLHGATLLPPADVAARVASLAPDKDKTVVLYCRSGARSLTAAFLMAQMGYTDVVSMAGGIIRWREENRAIEVPGQTPITRSADRYARHLVMPEIGPAGQERLGQSKVLVVGAGGLGSPALLYLAAAGVGTLGIIDFDTVDASNLQRQVIHTDDRVGMPKTESAAKTLKALNPDVRVVVSNDMLTDANVDEVISGFDLVIDGTDTFETRYTLNDAAVRARIPVVHASVYRFEGQLTVFKPFDGPCYRCLYPTPPPPELAPGCSVAGVLGVVPGVMGMLQATEALKMLLGIGEPLVGRLLLWDALDGKFDEVTLRRDPACPACGEGVLAAAH